MKKRYLVNSSGIPGIVAVLAKRQKNTLKFML